MFARAFEGCRLAGSQIGIAFWPSDGAEFILQCAEEHIIGQPTALSFNKPRELLLVVLRCATLKFSKSSLEFGLLEPIDTLVLDLIGRKVWYIVEVSSIEQYFIT